MRIFNDGPEVSFNGSPTVSPITAALWTSDPFYYYSPFINIFPPSIYFFALSQAPPLFDIDIAY